MARQEEQRMNTYTRDIIDALTDNIKTLPIEQIDIATPDGPKPHDALMLGDYALNENKEGWTVTHRKTGYAFTNFSTPVEALISLGILLGAGMPIDFTIEGFRDIPDIRAITARIKAGLDRLKAWDLDIDYNEPVD